MKNIDDNFVEKNAGDNLGKSGNENLTDNTDIEADNADLSKNESADEGKEKSAKIVSAGKNVDEIESSKNESVCEENANDGVNGLTTGDNAEVINVTANGDTKDENADDNNDALNDGANSKKDKKPFISRVKDKISGVKSGVIGFFDRIGEKIKGVKTRINDDGGKKFAKDFGAATWRGTKKLSKRWFIDAFTGMAQGLFVTLIAGLIVKQIGGWIGDNAFGNMLVTAGNIASFLMGAGIGAGIASYLKAPKLVIFASMVAGMVGAFSTEFLGGTLGNIIMFKGTPGNPISAYICALLATEIGMKLAGRTKLDILVVPLGMTLVTMGGVYVCKPFVWLIDVISNFIQWATGEQPILMGIIIAVVVGILLTMPTSSAAICISLKLGGLAGGAAVVGCACQMIGFAVQSYRENRVSGLISQGIGTSMLQIPNIMKKPIIFLPPIIASAIAGPLATAVFKLQCTFAGSGMGTSGLVGIFATIDASTAAGLPGWKISLGIALLFFVVPIVVCVLLSELMRKYKLINYGDMTLNYNN